jgi:hypothetical protein
MLKVTFENRFALCDCAVQNGLSEGRLVTFVVTEAPVAVHIDDDIALEFKAKIHRQPDDLSDRLRILAVDMEDGDLKHFGHIGGVRA